MENGRTTAIIDGKYQLVCLIGSGAMARVYKARRLDTGDFVAIKVMHSPGIVELDSSAVTRFKREFEVGSSVNHNSLVKLYDLGRLDGGSVYIAMEYLPFPSLKERLKAEGTMKPSRVKEILSQAAGALAELHSKGFVHRDLKPENMVLSPEGRLVILDFGLVYDDEKTALTKTGSLLGTPLYMPPEQILGQGAAAQSDIWQIGLIGYELLTGTLPFRTDDFNVLFQSIVKDEPAPVAKYLPDLDPGWSVLFDRCLQKNPFDRYESAVELGKAIDSLDSRITVHGPACAGSRTGASPRGKTDASKDGDLTVRGLRRWYSFATALMGLAALCWLGCYLLARHSYDAFDIQVHHGIDRVAVSWKSSTPYPCKIKIFSARAPGLTVVSDDNERKEHLVVLRGLKPGTRYKCSVLFPSGELSESFWVQRQSFEFSFGALEFESDVLQIYWRANRPLPVKVKFFFSDGGMQETSSPGKVSVNSASLLLSGRRLRDFALEFVSEKTDERRLERISGITRRRARDFVSAVYFDPAKFVLDLNRESLADRKVFARLIRKRMHEGGVLKAVQELSPYLPFVLDSDVLPTGQRMALFEALDRFLLVERYVQKEKIPACDLFSVRLGRFQVRNKATLRRTRKIVLYRGKDCLMRAQSLFPDKRTFVFNQEESDPEAYAELSIHVTDWSVRASIICSLNGCVCSIPFFIQRRGRKFIGIDCTHLRKGQNELMLTVYDMPSGLCAPSIKFDDLALLIE